MFFFLSRREDVRSKVYSRRVKLPKVNVIRNVWGKGTEGRNIIEA